MKSIHAVLAATMISLVSLALATPVFAASGTIKIITEPGEARIYINGKRIGTSPAKVGQAFTLKQIYEGKYSVEAVIEQGDWELFGGKEIFVAEDSLQTINITLDQKRHRGAGAGAKNGLHTGRQF